jgi:hypothetical protein
VGGLTRTALTDGPLLPPRACRRRHTLADADAAAALALLAGAAPGMPCGYSGVYDHVQIT